MAAYIQRRIVETIVVLFIVSFMSFMLIRLIPGDPVIAVLGLEAKQAEIDALRAQLLLDKPLLVQYGHWMSNILQGKFGKSIVNREDITSLIAKRLPVTTYIGLLSLLLSVLIGIPAGVVTAVRRGTFLDAVITSIANIGISIPVFWLGILGIYTFGLQLGWFPIQGYTSPFENIWLSLKQITMPVLCESVTFLAILARQTRSSMLEVIRQDYIRTAFAKGLKEGLVVRRHALKNCLIPIVTLLGLHIRVLIGGSVLIETVFNIPGIGRLLVGAVFDKDFVIVQVVSVVIALIVGLTNLIVDISYGWLDPRIRYE
jgi:peptide/nickel transport system permease protein